MGRARCAGTMRAGLLRIILSLAAATTLAACAGEANEPAPREDEQTESQAGSVTADEGCVVDGKRYAIEESFKRECNTCVCTAMGPSCTKIACLAPDQ